MYNEIYSASFNGNLKVVKLLLPQNLDRLDSLLVDTYHNFLIKFMKIAIATTTINEVEFLRFHNVYFDLQVLKYLIEGGAKPYSPYVVIDYDTMYLLLQVGLDQSFISHLSIYKSLLDELYEKQSTCRKSLDKLLNKDFVNLIVNKYII